MIHRGSCLCGGVRFEVAGGIGTLTLCHCSQCRKAQGSAFVAAAPVRSADFRLLSGEELLQAYESSPGKQRVFCRRCGSPVLSRRAADPQWLRIRVGLLDTPVGRRADAHIFYRDRPEWDDRLDELPRHDGNEPSRATGRSG